MNITKTQVGIQLFDSGQITKEIYNQESKKWIKLYTHGDYNNGKNNNEQTNEILEYTTKLYKKYLNSEWLQWLVQ